MPVPLKNSDIVEGASCPFQHRQDACATKKLGIVERASCPFRFNTGKMPVPLKNSDIVERASCPFRLEDAKIKPLTIARSLFISLND
ncbi:hypothetical protein QUB70_23455 [Microcoleus sp. A003_D6]|uniref:hypothetical protein n=1 Tax=Microcoleus sp. A003_D6 TaxID=3055266 RepID=UPI002FD794EA